MKTPARLIYFTVLILVFSFRASAEDFTDAIHAFLQHRVEVEQRDVGIVVGIVDDNGSSIISYGKLDNGTDGNVNGNTVFEIGSITKTFTALLLQDMVNSGEMKLNDPVAKYLPKSVKIPTYNGKEITLIQLAAHTSGLPTVSAIWIPKRADNSRAEYNIEKMYDFVSGYKLTREPGAKYEYSTVGLALLGQAIALKAGANYESLVVDRICRPLKMDSTRITLTPELQTRFAAGHNSYGYTVSSSYWGALIPGAGLRSTANDLLKYVSANLGLTQSALTPLMKKTHIALIDEDTNNIKSAMSWDIRCLPNETKIISQGGLTDGFISFICFDMIRRRGVVALTNSQDFDLPGIAIILLESQWQPNLRPKETKIDNQAYDSYVGQYQSQMADIFFPTGIGIRRLNNRLFVKAIGSKLIFADMKQPVGDFELLPESETGFFERLSGTPVTFSQDAREKVTGLTITYQDKAFSYKKTSSEPPEFPKPLRPRVAIKLDTKRLDAVVGKYEFEPNAAYPDGIKLSIWRERDRLVGQAWGRNFIQGAFDIFPESETDFFSKVDGAQLTFVKDDKGEVTGVIHHRIKFPEMKGKKL
ncbi:MAG: serine hydrolase [Sedimentisphaerales bacterium]